MKYVQLAPLGVLAFVASTLAQSINIATPATGDVLTIGGRPFTVEVDLPNTISPSQSVSVVISLQTCGTTRCPSNNDETLGQILFAGDYAPQLHENFKPPYQNFTFPAPIHINSGNATLHVAHFFLLGAGPTPVIETKNVSLLIRGAAGV